MDDAETSDELTPLHRSCAYRDALALGILALRPIRLKNLAQLTLSEHLTFDGSAGSAASLAARPKTKSLYILRSQLTLSLSPASSGI